MENYNVLHVKSAKKAINPIDISRVHQTTMDFGQIGVLCHEPGIPDDLFAVKSSFFSRMAPLVKPTYGRFSFRTVTAYCPYHMIAEDADGFFAGKRTWEGKTPSLRWMTMQNLWSFVYNHCSQNGSATDYDITYITQTGTQGYRKFTNKGRYYVKLLNQLGFALPQNVDLQTSSAWTAAAANTKLNIMPILAFCKVYNDWMSQSQRYNISQLTSLLRAIKHNETVANMYSNNFLSPQGLLTMFDAILLCYGSGYFTSAWRYPNAPIDIQGGTVDSLDYISVPNNGVSLGDAQYIDNNVDNVEVRYSASPSTQPIIALSQRALDFLQAFDNWVRRNNYSGSRAVQQIYSRFGIKTSDYRSNYAEIIKTTKEVVRVGDVTATASSASEPLGDYAGKGIMGAGDAVRYKVSDYGMFFILGYFTVDPMYPYGFDKEVLKTNPLDFYTPEFDGLGAEAISYGELYEDPTVLQTSQDLTLYNNVYGFTERYNSYRFGRDQITGDFRKFSKSAGENCWHTGRLLTDVRLNGNMLAQSPSMVQLDNVDSEYNRIFSVTSGIVDHFYLNCEFDFSGTKRGMLNNNQTPRLGEGDTAVPRNGNTIS